MNLKGVNQWIIVQIQSLQIESHVWYSHKNFLVSFYNNQCLEYISLDQLLRSV